MTRPYTLNIGPPHSPFGGMDTTSRKQQVDPNKFVMLRNVEVVGGALVRRKGFNRVAVGARTAKSLQLDGDAANFVQVPYADDSVNVTDFNLPTKWTIFVSYVADDLTDDILIAAHSTAASPPWSLVHNTNGTITAIVSDQVPNTATVTTVNTYSTGSEITVFLTRNGGTVSLKVNGDDAVTDTSTLSATSDTLGSTEAIFLGSWSGRPTGSEVTYHEFRMFRSIETSWRITQYPWSGRFGNPNLVLHMTFEDGSGSSVTDWSRNNHSDITIEGAGNWLGTTKRQVSTMVNGAHVMENARGRKWLLFDVGPNHYRIPLN